MCLESRSPPPVALVLAWLLSVTACSVEANHFILPCSDDCSRARWYAAGSMQVPRRGHTATLLEDGRVLIAGGTGDVADDGVPFGELYDPATSTWQRTGRMIARRLYHAATLLADGRVLVAGGEDGQDYTSAEIFDPATNVWSATGSMSVPRWDASAALLADGRVLVAGGWGSDAGGPIGVAPSERSAEVYDPVAKTWTPTGKLNRARDSGHSLTTLQDGSVLVVGGLDTQSLQDPGGGEQVREAERYDPLSGTWSLVGLIEAKLGHSATLLRDGRVLVVAGESHEYVPSRQAFLYDPATTSWTRTADLAYPRAYHAAVSLPTGDVLVIGGTDQHVNRAFVTPLASVERFDAVSLTWHNEARLVEGRYDLTATLLNDGTVLVAGGYAGDPRQTSVDAFAHTKSSAERFARSPARAHTTPTAIEYYHSELDRYFLTAASAEIVALDAGQVRGWARTGFTFQVSDGGGADMPFQHPVCRYLLPPDSGGSHFFSASAEECESVVGQVPGAVLETRVAFYVALPDLRTGACSSLSTGNARLRAVYRLWNRRSDANHRYTTDRKVRDAMVAKGYVSEGYGRDGVAFCVP